MPRLIIEHLKVQKSSRPILIEMDGKVIGDIAYGQVKDFFIFIGDHEITAKVGNNKSHPISISIEDREIISLQCWSSGIINKIIELRKIHQKKQVNRFSYQKDNFINDYSTKEVSNIIEASWASILGVAEDAGIKEIRDAYISLMKENHPDKVAQLNELQKRISQDKAIEITIAYNFAKKIVR